jgi:hypothetical protein
VHGQYIPEWVAVGYLLPALVMLYQGIEIFSGLPGAIGICGFGLLLGLAIGWVHGLLRLQWYRTRGRINDIAMLGSPPEDGNPYRPPRQNG